MTHKCCNISETNGGATDWKDIPWGQCSRLCVGIQKRTRHCNDPPPIGLNRTCEGGISQVQQCNHYPKNCSLDTREIRNSVSLKFPALNILRVSYSLVPQGGLVCEECPLGLSDFLRTRPPRVSKTGIFVILNKSDVELHGIMIEKRGQSVHTTYSHGIEPTLL